MTREEEIRNIADEHFAHSWSGSVKDAFAEGAQWADNNPNTISFTYLQNWYQDSIDETKEPIWTDKHLEELFNDFYLIPKNK